MSKLPNKATPSRVIRLAIVEADPLRLVGFRALFEDDPQFALKTCTPASIFQTHGYDVVMIGSRIGPAMYEIMAGLKSLHPSVRMVATGNVRNDELALRAETAHWFSPSASVKCSTFWSLDTRTRKSAPSWALKSGR